VSHRRLGGEGKGLNLSERGSHVIPAQIEKGRPQTSCPCVGKKTRRGLEATWAMGFCRSLKKNDPGQELVTFMPRDLEK